MPTRTYWALVFVIGGVIAFAWPYVFPPPGDKFAEGLFRAAAWVAGSGAAFAILRMGSRAGRINAEPSPDDSPYPGRRRARPSTLHRTTVVR